MRRKGKKSTGKRASKPASNPASKTANKSAGPRNSQTITFRGKKLKALTGKRQGTLQGNLRLEPVEFVPEVLTPPDEETATIRDENNVLIGEVDRQLAIDEDEVMEDTVESVDPVVAAVPVMVEPESVEDTEIEYDSPVSIASEEEEGEVEEDLIEYESSRPNELADFESESESESESDSELEIESDNSRSSDFESSELKLESGEIKLSDFESFDSKSDSIVQDYMDNMSDDLNDDELFALAASHALADYGDLDIFSSYDNNGEFDEYLNKLIKSGKPNVSERKKLKRQERHRMHALQANNCDPNRDPALWCEYTTQMEVTDVVSELQAFALRTNESLLSFPPFDSNANHYIMTFAELLGMPTKLKGKNKLKHIVVYRSNRTSCHFSNERKARQWMSRRKRFSRTDIVDLFDKVTSKQVDLTSARVRDGHVVGQHAQEISNDNFGHQLLVQMGWSAGMGLGKQKAGIIAPIPATVKLSKGGLGEETERTERNERKFKGRSRW